MTEVLQDDSGFGGFCPNLPVTGGQPARHGEIVAVRQSTFVGTTKDGETKCSCPSDEFHRSAAVPAAVRRASRPPRSEGGMPSGQPAGRRRYILRASLPMPTFVDNTSQSCCSLSPG